MIISEQQDKELEAKLKFISTVEVQSFISQFHNSNTSNKTFSFIEENFIKKYRFKNSITQNDSNPHSTVTQFINAFKETNQFYESYHQCKFTINKDLQSVLDKYQFTKDLKRFISQLYKSQSKAMNFFLTQIEIHRVFMAQNEAKYHKKVESLNEICSTCKQSMARKSFQNIKQQVEYNFSDPYKLYDKGKFNRLNDMNHLSYLDSTHPLKTIEELQQADMKMKQLLKDSKRIQFSKLDEIYQHFDTKQELQLRQLNKGKVNEMFYDLQIQLNNQSNQLQQYVDQIIGFNDRLINYHPNTGVKMQQKDQTEPKDVEKQLKYNFTKIIRKMYKKISQIIQKRKQEAISIQTQVNFTQQSALKEMDKIKKRLQLQLKQSKQEKKFLVASMKQENDTLKKEIKRLTEENNRIDVLQQETLLEKNNMQRKEQKLIKVINQLKKQIQRLNSVIDRKQYLASKKQLLISQNKLKSRVNLDSEPSVSKEEQKQEKHNGIATSKRTSKRHLIGVSKIEHQQNQTTSLTSSQQLKSPEQQLLEELQRHELELINNLAKKKLKNNKKKYLQPRRSKLLETITIEDSDLKKQVSRFSQAMLKETQQLNSLTNLNEQTCQFENENSDVEDSQFDEMLKNQRSSEIDRIIREPTIKEVIQKNQNEEQSQLQDQNSQHLLPKNHKSKTFTKINQRYETQSNQRGKSSRSDSQTEEDILKQLEQLRKLKKMKQIEIKLAALSNQNNDGFSKKSNFSHKSPERFTIQKQVQQNIIGPKANKSVDKSKSQTKKTIPQRGVHHQSLYKDDLLKRFGKNSQNFLQSPIQSNSSLSQLQFSSSNNSNQNQKLKNFQQRKCSVSIISKNFVSLCEQITKDFEDNKFHVGTQTLRSRDNILNALYEFQSQSRNWNQVLVPFDCYKFGYEEFIDQLCQLIAKQQKNPIRRLNGYKGSSDVLKKPHNYRFNKENLYQLNGNGQRQEQMLSMVEEEIKTKKLFSKNADEKLYFVPRFSNQISKNLMDDVRMNQTTAGGFFGNQKTQTEENEQYNLSNKLLLNSVSLSELKNQKNFKTFDSSILFNDTNYVNFKKKGSYTLHQTKTDGNSKEGNTQLGQKNKLPVISENLETIRMPSFQKQDAQNLYFTIESAKAIEENIKNNSMKQQLTFFTLEKLQIRFTTEILAILAHIHLLEPQSYNQIKNIIIYPAKFLVNKKEDIELNNQKQNQKNQPEDNETQLSLKNGLGYILQLHRKCHVNQNSTKQRSRTKESIRFVENSLQTKAKGMCSHLVSFRKKIGEVIKTHQILKNKTLIRQTS